MTEGSLQAPERHPVPWRDPDFLDEEKLDAEMRRQFDVCHGCRRCHNLCDSFPRLFDLIDESESLELDTVSSEDFRGVVDACTLCDMCFMTKCPYVPPHEFNLDIPHLMLRYRAVQRKKGEIGFVRRQLAETDRNGKLAAPVAPLANWATDTGNTLARPVVEAATGIDRRAAVPKFHGRTLTMRARSSPAPVNRDAPAFGRKAVVYATCFVNYNDPETGEDALEVLARNGVEAEVVYPACCGMPKFEHGDIEAVARNARRVAAALIPWVDKGYDVVALTPSCTLMLKFEWPLLLPEDDDLRRLSEASWDITQYVVDIARKEGLADEPKPLGGSVTVHLACHARAQNVGQKAAELLRLIPETDVQVIERCSGHGGSWGMMKENFDTALKIGRPAARRGLQADGRWVVSECPLAGDHLRQGMERLAGDGEQVPEHVPHPIRLLAQACRRQT